MKKSPFPFNNVPSLCQIFTNLTIIFHVLPDCKHVGYGLFGRQDDKLLAGEEIWCKFVVSLFAALLKFVFGKVMCFLSKIFIISQVGDPVYNFDEENTSSPYEGPNPLPDMLARLVAKKKQNARPREVRWRQTPGSTPPPPPPPRSQPFLGFRKKILTTQPAFSRNRIFEITF